MSYHKQKIKPNFQLIDGAYHQGILTEYRQSYEEGLDIEKYKDLFQAVSKMDADEYKAEISDILYRQSDRNKHIHLPKSDQQMHKTHHQ